MKTLKLVTLSLLLGFLVYYVLERRRKGENQTDAPANGSTNNSPNSPTGNAANDTRTSPSAINMEEVHRSFLAYADNFRGIYEPLYKASKGIFSEERKRNALREWDLRMSGFGQFSLALKDWWATIATGLDTLSDDDLRSRAQQVVTMLIQCGIVRDERVELVAEADTTMFYQNVEGKTWGVGQRLRVESPCWYINCQPVRVLEKGCCEII